LFEIGPNQRLSAMVELDPLRSVIVPTLGGLALGLIGLLIARYRPRRAVDPIEANALYGGRMSLNDGLVVMGQTIMSNGVGASIGLARIREWIARNQETALAGVAVVLAIWFAGKGIRGLR